jgi:hypothetical protein
MPDHHVVWLPGPEDKMALAIRILRMLDIMPVSHVARILTEERVLSPDAGRTRKDGGIKHEVSGAWHATTCVNVAFSMLLLGRPVYGRRSIGDQKRFSPGGPRDLCLDDYRAYGEPKVIRNPDSQWIVGPPVLYPLSYRGISIFYLSDA